MPSEDVPANAKWKNGLGRCRLKLERSLATPENLSDLDVN
jgi:hypothetical protein